MRNLNLQEIFFFIILIAVTIGFLYVIGPFILDIFMAIVLAMLFRNPMMFFVNRYRKKYLAKQNTKTESDTPIAEKDLSDKQKAAITHKAAMLTLLLVLVVMVIPMTFVGFMVSKEVGSTYISFTDNWPNIQNFIKEIPDKAKEIPFIERALEHVNWDEIAKGAQKLATTVAGFIFTLIQNTFINIGILLVHFFIVMFLLYYLLADGKTLVKKIQYLLPLNDDDERELFFRMEDVTDALIINTFMIGIIEGTYGGILFALLGVPSPFFWGTMMVFLSIIPLVGANTILVPMGIIQIAIGNIGAGIIILVVGTGAILINQNIIRPRLDGHRSGMHPAIMFLASMGGLVWLGIVGFLVGPMITALFLIIWDQFGIRYHDELEAFNLGKNKQALNPDANNNTNE
ncbi:MAG: AI-2E family transporter [Bacteroidales bacterium]|nr:AI-2E family transporter [Bacteroidales bacterium]